MRPPDGAAGHFLGEDTYRRMEPAEGRGVKYLGISMIIALFAGIFIVTALMEGWRDTLLIFLGATAGAVWITIACYWAVRG